MILESALWRALALYQGWRYRPPTTEAHYPAPLPGVRTSLAPPGPCVADCCTVVEGLVLGAAQASGAPLVWSPALHARAVASRGLWPTEAYAAAGLADDVPAELLDAGRWPAWTVLQGWTRDPMTHPPGPGSATYGHTMLLVRRSGEGASARALVLHCGRLPGVPDPGGVGWRGIGPLASGPPGMAPPVGWEAVAPTWGEVRRLWPTMRGCALRVVPAAC